MFTTPAIHPSTCTAISKLHPNHYAQPAVECLAVRKTCPTLFLHLPICLPLRNTHLHENPLWHSHTYIHTQYTQVHACTHTGMWIHMPVHTCMHIQIPRFTCTQVCTHTHKHTHTTGLDKYAHEHRLNGAQSRPPM